MTTKTSELEDLTLSIIDSLNDKKEELTEEKQKKIIDEFFNYTDPEDNKEK